MTIAVRPSIPGSRYAERLRRASELVGEGADDALLVGVGPDLRYLTGYEAMPLERLTLLVVLPGDVVLVAPRLEEAAAQAGTRTDVRIATWEESDDPYALVADGGNLVGIFTDRDAVLKVAGLPLRSRPIAELMTRDPVVLRHDDTVAVAIHKMAVGGFRHIPIVEDGRPIGIVSARDVFGHLAEMIG